MAARQRQRRFTVAHRVRAGLAGAGLGLIACAVAGLIQPAGAVAGVVGVDSDRDSDARTIRFTSDPERPGAGNVVTVSRRVDRPPPFGGIAQAWIVLRAEEYLRVGDDPHQQCLKGAQDTVVECKEDSVTLVVLDLGAGDDVGVNTTARTVRMLGGEGSDRLCGDESTCGHQYLSGLWNGNASHDLLDGGPCDDVLDGGPGVR